MRPGRRIAGLLLFALSLAAGATELDVAAQTRLGLRLAALGEGRVPAGTRAIAEVLDPVPLAREVEGIRVAQAAARASDAELRRTQALLAAQGNASRKALELARTQAVADGAKLRLARMALRSHWGDGLADMAPSRLDALVQALVAGRRVLLKAEPVGRPDAQAQADGATLHLPAGADVSATVLGRLPRSRSGLAAGWLLLAPSGPLVPGMVLTVRLQDRGQVQHGMLLPRAAIVRWNGLAWAYVAIDATHFERRAVTPIAMTPAGWLVGAPFKPGERVVVQGAASLVAVDAAPQPGSAAGTAEDDD